MRFNCNTLTFAALATAMSLGLSACHGQPGSTSYMPTTTSSLPAPQADTSGDLGLRGGNIISTCGTLIKIKLLGIVNCKFREARYKHRLFKIINRSKGILNITPLIGNEATAFTVVGLLLGDGHFLVKDVHRHVLVVKVKVKL